MKARLFPALFCLLLPAGCGDSGTGPSGGERPVEATVSRTVETMAVGITERRRDVYESVLAEDFSVVNEAGECLDWLDPAYWSDSPPEICGGRLLAMEVVQTGEREVAAQEIEATFDVTTMRGAGSTGASSDSRFVFRVVSVRGGYRIRELRVPALFGRRVGGSG